MNFSSAIMQSSSAFLSPSTSIDNFSRRLPGLLRVRRARMADADDPSRLDPTRILGR
jgi:hypothetical protein